MPHALPQPSYDTRPSVVVVDDHATFRRSARMLLEASGYEVVGEASSGAGALEAVERHTPDAVLLDVRLGDDDGCEVCGALLRSHPGLAVLLASADDQDPEQVAGCGARGFVHKSRLLETDFSEFFGF